jgi:hypothetical protein
LANDARIDNLTDLDAKPFNLFPGCKYLLKKREGAPFDSLQFVLPARNSSNSYPPMITHCLPDAKQTFAINKAFPDSDPRRNDKAIPWSFCWFVRQALCNANTSVPNWKRLPQASRFDRRSWLIKTTVCGGRQNLCAQKSIDSLYF